MKENLAPTNIKINELISKRWSPRVFDSTKEVSTKDITIICEAARWAPSCANSQPYRYIVWNRNINPIDFERAFDVLDEWNRHWVKNCNILMVAISETQNSDGRKNNWAEYDTGAASENICLQATDLGMFAHQMAGFDSAALSKEFDIPPRFKPMAMIAIGYKSEDLTIVDEKYQKTEVAERVRKPLENNFFDSKWNNPIY